jgi:hypothetical protein
VHHVRFRNIVAVGVIFQRRVDIFQVVRVIEVERAKRGERVGPIFFVERDKVDCPFLLQPSPRKADSKPFLA